jgi:uncharacterized Rmd1/YagE family protein
METGSLAPPPSNMTVFPVRAYAIASTLRPRDVAGCFPNGTPVRTTKTQVIVQYGADSWAVLYDFGAIVFVNVREEERDRVMKAILARVGPEPHPPLVDDYAVAVRAGATPEVKFDHVVVGSLEKPAVELLALVTAQSVAMEYYEEDVEQLLGRLDRVSDQLANSGRFRARQVELMRLIGQGMATRNQVVHTLALLDAPLIAWESEVYDRVYRALRVAFEIEDRYRALDHKLRMVQDNLELLVDLTRHRRSIMLEGTVIALIAIEILLFLFQMAHHG